MGLSEKELTEMAILKSQGDTIALKRREVEASEKAEKATLASKTEDKKRDVKPLASKTSKAPQEKSDAKGDEPKEDLPDTDPETGMDLTQFKNVVKLGEGKFIHFKNWTGRTKKLLKKELKDLQTEDDLDVDALMETLVRDYIAETDIYLSPVELQYMIVKLREVSIGDEYTYQSNCPTCKMPQEITGSTNDIYRYTPSKYPYQDQDFGFVDIDSQSDLDRLFDDMINSEDYDGITTKSDLEIAMHIKNGDLSAIEILDLIDEMELIPLKNLMTTLSEIAPKMEQSLMQKCDNKDCEDYRKNVKFIADDIPDIFDDLL